MYADQVTDSMRRAISETTRRRSKQLAYNAEHDIDPQTIRKKVVDILAMVRAREGDEEMVASGARRGRRAPRTSPLDLPRDELARLIQGLQDEMLDASRDLRFEEAARLRDEIKELKRELREVG